MSIGQSEVAYGNYCKNEQLLEVEHEKDLRVIIDNKLDFLVHFNKKMNMADKMALPIIRSFESLDEEIFKKLYVALVRPHLEYANKVWALYLMKDIKVIKSVQRRVITLVLILKNLSYEEHQRKLKLPTLAYRRHD